MIILVINEHYFKEKQSVNKPKHYYTTVEAAKALDVSVRTIQLWVEDGKLEGWKTAGGHRRIASQSIENMLKGQHQAQHKTKPAKPNVLIVEDNPTVLKFYEAAISSWQYPLNIITAEDGFAGLMQVGKAQPVLIISDIYMPGMDGLQMIRALHKEVNLENVEIVVISGLTEDEILERGGIPHKPVDLDKLKMIVDKTVARHLREEKL